jgi:ribosomal protein S27E
MNEKRQRETVKCSWCGRELAEVRGVQRAEVRCAECRRTTYYFKSVDKPQDIVLVKA